MPLYEYACRSCGRTFEEVRRMSEADQPIACPACRSRETTRRVTTPGRVMGAINSIASQAVDCAPSGGT